MHPSTACRPVANAFLLDDLAASDQSILDSSVLSKSDNRRVNTRRCFAASTIRSGRVEMAGEGLAAALQALLSSGQLARERPHLLKLATDAEIVLK